MSNLMVLMTTNTRQLENHNHCTNVVVSELNLAFGQLQLQLNLVLSQLLIDKVDYMDCKLVHINKVHDEYWMENMVFARTTYPILCHLACWFVFIYNFCILTSTNPISMDKVLMTIIHLAYIFVIFKNVILSINTLQF